MRRSLVPAYVVAAMLLAYADSTASYEQISSGPTNALSMTKTGSRLTIHGSVSSTAHEAILRQTAAALMPDHNLKVDVRHSSTLPTGWSLVTDVVIRAVANTHSATVLISEDQIVIRGVVTDAAAWSMSVNWLGMSVSDGMQLDVNVVTVQKSSQFERLCEDLMISVLQDAGVQFAKSSSKLGTASLSLLDEIVEIATDCPSLSITVTGYRDDAGSGSANHELGRTRAEAVVSYMIQRGIRPQRLAANEAGLPKANAAGIGPAGLVTRQLAFELSFP